MPVTSISMEEQADVREVLVMDGLGEGGREEKPQNEDAATMATGLESRTQPEPDRQGTPVGEQLAAQAKTAATSKAPSRTSDVASTGSRNLGRENCPEPLDFPSQNKAKWHDIWESTFKRLSFRSLVNLDRSLHDIATRQSRVAIFESRRAALLATCFHLIPIITSIGISLLTIRGTYTGSDFPFDHDGNFAKIIALQIVAKVHELFVVASLTSMIFTLIRRELALKKGVPFAAVSAASNIGNAAFLWSKEFISLFRGDFASRKARVLLISSIVVGVGMALAVAPAVATLIVPTMASWPVGGTSIWINASTADLFPSVVDRSNTLPETCAVAGSEYCPSASWTGLRDIFAVPLASRDTPQDGLPDVGNFFWFRLHGGEAGVTITNRVRNRFSGYPLRSVAAAPHVAISRAMSVNGMWWNDAALRAWDNGNVLEKKQYRFRSTDRLELAARAPVTHTKCWLDWVDTQDLPDPATIRMFPEIRELAGPEFAVNSSELSAWFDNLSAIARPQLLWLDAPSERERISILAAVAIPMPAGNTTVALYGCSVVATYMPITYFDTIGSYAVSLDAKEVQDVIDGVWVDEPTPRWNLTSIRPEFANYVNPRANQFEDRTVFEEMALASALWKPEDPSGGSNQTNHMESVIAVMLLNGLIRVAPYAAQVGRMKGVEDRTWWRGFIPGPSEGYGDKGELGSAYTTTEDERRGATEYHLKVKVTGYGYGRPPGDDASNFGSLVVMWIYLAIAFFYIGWSMCTGITTSSWSSSSELLALALKSPVPHDHLESSGDGASDGVSLKARYLLGVQGGKVVFRPAYSESEPGEKVQPNVRYS